MLLFKKELIKENMSMLKHNKLKKIDNEKPKEYYHFDSDFVKRSTFIMVLLFAMIVVLNMGKLFSISIINGDSYRESAESSQLYDTTIEALRGSIYDANLVPLVSSSTSYQVCLSPYSLSEHNFYGDTEEEEAQHQADYLQYLSENIAEILGMEEETVYDYITATYTSGAYKTYQVLASEVYAAQKIELDEFLGETYVYTYSYFGQSVEAKIYSTYYFYYESDWIREYSENNLASTVIGVVNYDNIGIAGIESYYDEELSGEDGRIVTAQDAYGNSLSTTYESIYDATAGYSLVLTIDSNIQMYLENTLEQCVQDTDPNVVFGIVMDVDTGAILAMSNKPDFDLNSPNTFSEDSFVDELNELYAETLIEKGYEVGSDEAINLYSTLETQQLYEQWSNFCIQDTYEPGSTYKIFTAAMGLEEGIIDVDTTYTCTGECEVSGITFNCSNLTGHGTQTLTEGLMNSCNPFFIEIGQELGVDTYYKYFEAFGFTELTGVDFISESNSVVHSYDSMGLVELASTSFGQSIEITPIQMITATCAIANGGDLMVPYLVDSILDEDMNVISQTEPTIKREVISEETAEAVCAMMEAVVIDGTGSSAYIAGYRLAGKTATAEKLSTTDIDDDYTVSYVAFAPADDPQVAILIGIDEPQAEYVSGGALVGPLILEVMESTLTYLNIEPQYTEEELEEISELVIDFVGMSVTQVQSLAWSYGYTVEVSGDGDTVISQLPVAGSTVPSDGTIVIYT